MSSEKITGWVAWHPDYGVSFPRLTKSACVHALTNADKIISLDCESYFRELDILFAEKEAQGWRIRPVEIVFADEGEK